jgi:hypothetical protein
MRTGANYAHNLENRIPLNYYLKPDGTVISQNLIKSERERGTPMFRTGLIQNYGVGLRGGQQKYTYYLSADYTDEEGYDWENAQKKGSLRSNLQLAASDQLDISADLGMLKTDLSYDDDSGTNAMRLIIRGLPQTIDTPLRGFAGAPPRDPEPHGPLRARESGHGVADVLASAGRLVESAGWVLGIDLTDQDRTTFTPKLDDERTRSSASTSRQQELHAPARRQPDVRLQHQRDPGHQRQRELGHHGRPPVPRLPTGPRGRQWHAAAHAGGVQRERDRGEERDGGVHTEQDARDVRPAAVRLQEPGVPDDGHSRGRQTARSASRSRPRTTEGRGQLGGQRRELLEPGLDAEHEAARGLGLAPGYSPPRSRRPRRTRRPRAPAISRRSRPATSATRTSSPRWARSSRWASTPGCSTIG